MGGSLPENEAADKCQIGQILGSAYYGDEKRPTINFLDPLTLPNDPLHLFERLFRIKKRYLFLKFHCKVFLLYFKKFIIGSFWVKLKTKNFLDFPFLFDNKILFLKFFDSFFFKVERGRATGVDRANNPKQEKFRPDSKVLSCRHCQWEESLYE